MKTPKEYVESLRKFHPVVYIKGKLVSSVPDEPLLRPGINAISLTYDYATKPDYRDIMVTTSHITGKEISRLLHIDTNTDDLLKKLEMTRLLCRTAGCAQ
ncbi:MAG TPA: 4-hydroxyphenylacetate 3-hydroxylase N-terminal domain-containing protein, partial [Thermodesulfobacteriota bacterium]|nr:4-hydroxyphenylacetate 3-hydroxylase N-terminal domain-containing protein [Thermodesulfobacteriota bacterium]